MDAIQISVAASKDISHRRALTLRASKGLRPFGNPKSGNPAPRAQGVFLIKVYDVFLKANDSFANAKTVNRDSEITNEVITSYKKFKKRMRAA